MTNEENGLNSKQYYILSRMLWGIHMYPYVGIPYTRVGFLEKHDGYFAQFDICFEDDTLTLSKNGMESTIAGSDSFETIFLHLEHNDVLEKVNNNKEIDLADLDIWYQYANQLLADRNIEYTIEYSE